MEVDIAARRLSLRPSSLWHSALEADACDGSLAINVAVCDGRRLNNDAETAPDLVIQLRLGRGS